MVDESINIGPNIQGTIINVRGGSIGEMFTKQYDYDILFTEKGLIFARVGGSIKMNLLFPLARGMPGSGGLDGGKQKRDIYQKLSLKEILRADKNNFFVPYKSIQKVWLRKTFASCGFEFKDALKRRGYVFSKDQFENAQRLIGQFLRDKLQQGWL